MVASSAVANLCLIPETAGEAGGGGGRVLREDERSKVKASGKWQKHASESNHCEMTKGRESYREKRAWVCMCFHVPPKRTFMSH